MTFLPEILADFATMDKLRQIRDDLLRRTAIYRLKCIGVTSNEDAIKREMRQIERALERLERTA